jgi:hypothetical protein
VPVPAISLGVETDSGPQGGAEKLSSEENGPNPFERVDELSETSDDAGILGSPWDRRTFLKAAALGTAAAALWQKGPGLTLGPAAAYADDLSALQCTSNDVRIVGTGQVLNEPCVCSGTFNALVQFQVQNNAASDRSCITLHLCPGGGLPAQDIILSPVGGAVGDPIPGKTTSTMQGTIQNFPCGAGLVCFGATPASGVQGDVFAKGENCPTGQCCSTITWGVPGQDTCPLERQIASKCRHQQICIQGRGQTTLDCDTATTGVQTNCAVQCGSTATVQLCTTEAASLGPFTFTLHVPGQPDQTFGPTTDKCHNFTVGPITANTTITGDVKSGADNCIKSASVTLTTTAITPTITVTGNDNCNGQLTFDASATGFTGCTKAWTIDGFGGSDLAAHGGTVNADGSLSYRSLDGTCHTIGVTLTCGGCSGTASRTVCQCVHTTLGCTAGANCT